MGLNLRETLLIKDQMEKGILFMRMEIVILGNLKTEIKMDLGQWNWLMSIKSLLENGKIISLKNEDPFSNVPNEIK